MTSDGRVVRCRLIAPSGEGRNRTVDPSRFRGEATLGPSARNQHSSSFDLSALSADRPERPTRTTIFTRDRGPRGFRFSLEPDRVSVTNASRRSGRPLCPVQPAHVPSLDFSLPSRSSCSWLRSSRPSRRWRPTRRTIRAPRRARNRPPSRRRNRPRNRRRSRLPSRRRTDRRADGRADRRADGRADRRAHAPSRPPSRPPSPRPSRPRSPRRAERRAHPRARTSDAARSGRGRRQRPDGVGRHLRRRWQPGEAVQIFVNDHVGTSWSHTATAAADAGGRLTYEFSLPDLVRRDLHGHGHRRPIGAGPDARSRTRSP